MSDLRDMDAVTVKCRDLMVGDFVCLKDDTKYELPLKVDGVLTDDISLEGEGFLGGAEGLIRPIPITPEMIVRNGWDVFTYEIGVATYTTYCSKKEVGNYLEWKRGTLSIWFDYKENSDGVYSDILVPCKYVHQLQQALRLAGMTEMANNFKV